MTIIQLSNNGKTPFQKLLGYNSEIMKNWNNLSESLERDQSLSKELKEEMRRMLAQKNGCMYCKAKGKPSNQLADKNISHLEYINKRLGIMSQPLFVFIIFYSLIELVIWTNYVKYYFMLA